MQDLMNFMNVDPLPHFFCYEVTSPTRSNAVCNMTVDKTFCDFTDGSFGGSIVCRKDKSTSSVSVYFSKDKLLPLP